MATLWTSAYALDERESTWIRGVFTGRSPRPQLVAESEAWHRVDEIVRTTPDTFTLVGTGDSMQPLYPHGTILVLRETAFADLQPGQTAVYRNAARRPVAHVLIAKARDGWRARGLNNRQHDLDAVVPDNLVGVVVAAFTPIPPATGGIRLAAR